MSKRAPVSSEPFPSILADVLANRRGRMSPAAAREFLELGFNEAHQARADDLAARNTEGLLTPAERAELIEFARTAHIVAMLQSEARMVLKRARKVKA